VRVLTFGLKEPLIPVINLGLYNPRKKERKKERSTEQFVGSYVINRMLTKRIVQPTQERRPSFKKKKRKKEKNSLTPFHLPPAVLPSGM